MEGRPGAEVRGLVFLVFCFSQSSYLLFPSHLITMVRPFSTMLNTSGGSGQKYTVIRLMFISV